jgi:hypothetical protein
MEREGIRLVGRETLQGRSLADKVFEVVLKAQFQRFHTDDKLL